MATETFNRILLNNLDLLINPDLELFKKLIEQCIDICELIDFDGVEGILHSLIILYKKDNFTPLEYKEAYEKISTVIMQDGCVMCYTITGFFNTLLTEIGKDIIDRLKVKFSEKFVDNPVKFKLYFYNWYKRFTTYHRQEISKENFKLLMDECSKIVDEVLKTLYISDPIDRCKLLNIQKSLIEAKDLDEKSIYEAIDVNAKMIKEAVNLDEKLLRKICWVKFYHNAFVERKEQTWKLM